MSDQQTPLFGDDDVISVYSDSQAVEDGVLVPVSKTDRVTVAAFAWIEQNVGTNESPPPRWPVELMAWCGAERDADKAGDGFVAKRRAVAAARGVIGVHGPQARKVWEENIDGGVCKFEHGSTVFWLIPNELGGITFMFPSDY